MLKQAPDFVAKSGPSDAVVMNAWYVAAWSSELSTDVLARRIAGRAMLLRRTASSGVEAAEDRPPLAGAPEAFPVLERDGIIWVFPGDPARAGDKLPPEHPWITQWWSAVGYERIAARASLLIDNLLDLSHETYLHARGIGTAEVAETPIDVERRDDRLYVSRRMYGVACPPAFQASTGLPGPIDRAQEIEFFPPSFYVLHARVAAAGDTGHGLLNKVVYGITPETARATHLFYGIARELDGRDDVPEAARQSTQSRTVGEDKRALELLETVIASEPDAAPEVSIGIDRGGLLGRRMIAELVARETVTP
jgi:phenylpropionate dioxygenase-like ring-hydroxylating dioxygenase large terminal subunit